MEKPFTFCGFTRDDHQTMIHMQAEGKTLAQVAKALRKHYVTVQVQAWFLGLTYHGHKAQIPPGRVAAIRKLAAAGLSRSETAVALELSATQVATLAQRYDVAFMDRRGIWKGNENR